MVLSSSFVLDSIPVDELKTDLWGSSVRTRSESCLDFLNCYYLQVLSYGPDQSVIVQAADADRNCSLACALAAIYLLGAQGSTNLAVSANGYLSTANSTLDKATAYEKLVVPALVSLAEGQIEDALAAHVKILMHYPKDLVSLKRAQLLSFKLGCPNEMWRFAIQVLPANLESAFMYGMLAFGLIEIGRSEEAESAARIALAIEDRDVWAQHALCHVLEYQGRYEEALSFMNRHSDAWKSCCSFMSGHNWWHLAICEMEIEGDAGIQKVMTIYEKHIWGPGHKTAQKCINALSLLLLLDICGHIRIVVARLTDVTSCLTDPVFWHKEMLLDLLSIWAFSRINKLTEANQKLEEIRNKFHPKCCKENTKYHSLPLLASALYEFGRYNNQAVCQILGPTFSCHNLQVQGASHQQVILFQKMWQAAVARAGHQL